jgi:GNAT superfamily N-acetyltransferase
VAEVREAVTEEEVAATYPVMWALRPHHPKDGYPGRVRRMRESGYRLAAVIEEGEARAVAGFRVQEFLAWGRLLYVDDLVTAEESRSRGYGKLLLDWLAGKAQRESCEQLHLDSGVQRKEAHCCYFREGMGISSFHFARTLDV